MRTASTIRIIAGQWRSRRIDAPAPGTTRPMPDRVKEALFGTLGSRFGTPGTLPPVQVADLFAGSGSLGLEAVSRGAAGCVFVEKNRRAFDVLRRNLDRLGPDTSLRIVCADAWTWSGSADLESSPKFELMFVDPPYVDSRDTEPGGKVPVLLNRLFRRDFVSREGIVVLHHERRVIFPAQPGGDWSVADRREYGSTAITYVVHHARRSDGEPRTSVRPDVPQRSEPRPRPDVRRDSVHADREGQ